MDSTSKPVYCKEKDMTFPSINSVVMTLGLKYIAVRKVLAGVAKTHRGYTFEWYEPSKHPAPTKI